MRKINPIVNIIAVLALIAGGLSMDSAPARRAARLQPQVAQLAVDTPAARIRVIVQAVAQPAAEVLAEGLGATITADLPLINAFAAEMTAGAAQELAAYPTVRWVSLDAPMVDAGCGECVTASNLTNAYVAAIGADKVWGSGLQGQGIGVAVVDSGVNWQTDLYTVWGVNRVVANVSFHGGYNATTFDAYSHGSHVAGIIGGNGRTSGGKYIGVAPLANIVNVKVSDDLQQGLTTASSVVQGLQWIYDHRTQYNIRVVNLSLNGTTPESYHTSPLDAAVEVLWFNGIVVVASAGNQGESALYPPANDPFVITVGAVDDHGTAGLSDDTLPVFSAFGKTIDGFSRPDLVAPGRNIVSLMGNAGQGLPAMYPNNIVDQAYFRISGTSMAAPMVAGATALLLQDEPTLTPDQVKYRLMATANKSWPGYSAAKAGAGYLDVYAAVNGTTTQTANTGLLPSRLLSTGSDPITWGSVGWNSVGWNSVGWNSVGWNSVGWNSVGWNSDYWGP